MTAGSAEEEIHVVGEDDGNWSMEVWSLKT
jgi:hypothetical protein